MTDEDDIAGGISERISRAVRAAGGARLVAQRAGLSDSTIGNWSSGQTSPKAPDLVRLARGANCSVAWLMTGIGPSSGSAQGYRDAVSDAPAPFRHDERHIPAAETATPGEFLPVLRHDITVSAGDGLAAVEPSDRLAPLAFRGDWLRRTVSSLDNAALVNVRGDSMAPLIQDGDLLLIDRGARNPAAGGLFVLRLGDDIVVKRIAPSTGQRFRISSENAELYPAFDVPEDDVEIVGRVRWVGRSV